MKIIEETYNWNGSFENRSSTDYIVLHHAEAVSCTAQDIHMWHLANGWTGIGYHFFIRKDGSIYRGRPLWAVGAHVSGKNNCSVGICAEGDYHNKDKSMPAAQKNSIIELVKYLKDMYPNAKVVGHREIGSSDCPGQYYPLEEIKNKVNEEEIDMEELEKLKERVAALEAQCAVYNYVDDNMPAWAKPTVQKLMDKGALMGDEQGRLGLTMDTIRVLVMLDRQGVLG